LLSCWYCYHNSGLIQVADPSTQIVGFSALKELNFKERTNILLKNQSIKNYCLIKNYHFGGFAKKSNDLIDFMNTFYEKHCIPLDFVYTAKMMYGVIDMINQNYFPEKSRVLCIHTGGLQGNSSLMPGVLKY
jgi:1-aminocyclopropane-1-carboxylate deaminase